MDITYTSIFILMGATWYQGLILFGTHFIIDPLKARYGIVKDIWMDQLLHFMEFIYSIKRRAHERDRR